jgi:hypothetical protein
MVLIGEGRALKTLIPECRTPFRIAGSEMKFVLQTENMLYGL